MNINNNNNNNNVYFGQGTGGPSTSQIPNTVNARYSVLKKLENILASVDVYKVSIDQDVFNFLTTVSTDPSPSIETVDKVNRMIEILKTRGQYYEINSNIRRLVSNILMSAEFRKISFSENVREFLFTAYLNNSQDSESIRKVNKIIEDFKNRGFYFEYMPVDAVNAAPVVASSSSVASTSGLTSTAVVNQTNDSSTQIDLADSDIVKLILSEEPGYNGLDHLDPMEN